MIEKTVWDQDKMFRLQGNLQANRVPYTLKYERESGGRNDVLDKWTFSFDQDRAIDALLGGDK